MRRTHKKSDVCTAPYHKDCELAALLAECRMSKAELARRVGVHPNTVTNWLSVNAKKAKTQAKIPGAVLAYLRLYRDVRLLIDRG